MLALVLDVETTGLINNHTLSLDRQPEVVEFCGILVNLEDARVIDELDMLIKPVRPIAEEITKKNHIDNVMLESAMPFSEYADQIQHAIEHAPCVITHNASFDTEMLEIEFQRLGRHVHWPRVICTVEQTVWINGYRLNLAALYKHLFGQTFAGAHRARADVEALVKCCVELHSRGDI
jgi:DNA polymerase III subunit alpha